MKPDIAELTLASESVEFFDKTKSMWGTKMNIDCHEFLGEVVDPDEIVHRGYAVKIKGTGVVDIIFKVTSPPTFIHPEGWLWKYAKCGCVQNQLESLG